EPGPASPEAQAILRQIYPLRYLVVGLGNNHFENEWRPTWLALRRSAPSLYHFRGTYGTDDLYEISPTPEAAWHLERLVSYDFLLRHPTLELALRPRAAGADLEESADLSFNGRVIQRIQLDAPAHVVTTLRLPFHVSAPNRVE